VIDTLVNAIDRLFYSGSTQILMYHGFSQGSDVSSKVSKHVTVADFEEQLEFLVSEFNPISLTLFFDACNGKVSLPPRSVVLTFDDGYASNYELAFPLLKRYQVPATVYLTTEFVLEKRLLWTDKVELSIQQGQLPDAGRKLAELTGISELASESNWEELVKHVKGWIKCHSECDKQVLVEKIMLAMKIEEAVLDTPATAQPLTEDSIREMLGSGLIEFGAHTRTHPILSRCNDEQVVYEILTSVREVETLIGQPCRHFAYPNGRENEFDQRSVDTLKKAGIETAMTTIEGENDRNSDLYRLKRIGVYNGISLHQFKANLQPGRRRLAILKNRLNGRSH